MVIEKATLQKAVTKASSCSEVLLLLGIVNNRNNIRKIYYYIKRWGIDISHMNRGHFSKGRVPNNVIPLKEILVEGTSYRGSNSILKKRLIRAGYFEHKCYSCNLT
jgi:hypothetical protein